MQEQLLFPSSQGWAATVDLVGTQGRLDNLCALIIDETECTDQSPMESLEPPDLWWKMHMILECRILFNFSELIAGQVAQVASLSSNPQYKTQRKSLRNLLAMS